nr:putative wax ester synthase/acyl-CoA:diacylglycerol acyltransferase [uncultured bacterium]
MMATYERLSALDGTFLAFETPNTYMHVALVTVFEAGDLAGVDGLDIARIREYFASRLHFVPRYRQKLRAIPLTGDAVWVDDASFELEYHVRHASLPRPGRVDQLQRRCAEILERPLDRARPMWEAWFIEGLSGGRFAMITKVHHCMVDGVAGVDILAALLTAEPTVEIERTVAWTPRRTPSDRELLAGEMAQRARASGRLLRGLGAAAASPSESSKELPRRFKSLWNLVRTGAATPPAVSFNRPIGPHRRVAWTETPIESILGIKKALGGSLNDVVLTTAAGAVRRFLDYRDEPAAGPFRIVVPVSVRRQDERGQTGNRVSAWIVDLPIGEQDPVRRFAEIADLTRSLKEDEQALGAQMITEAAELTTGNVLSLGARVINQSHLYNMIVTNVPGPRIPLYLLGSRMAAAYPHVPLFADQGLGIALFSYGDKLYWGVAADWDLVPEVKTLGGFIDQAFAELLAAALPAKSVAAHRGQKRAPRRRPKRSPTRPRPSPSAADPQGPPR